MLDIQRLTTFDLRRLGIAGSVPRSPLAGVLDNESQHLIEGDQLAGELAGTSNQETVVLPRDRDVSVSAAIPVIREHKAEFECEDVHLFAVHGKTINPNAHSVNPPKAFFLKKVFAAFGQGWRGTCWGKAGMILA